MYKFLTLNPVLLFRACLKPLFMLLAILLVNGQSLAADAALEDYQKIKQALKDELLTELLQSQELKDYIQQEIKAYQKNKQTVRQKIRSKQQQTLQQKIQKQLRPVSLTEDHIYGNPEAPISIIEYSDFECPFCRKVHLVLKRLVNESEGQVNWVFRHFPLGFHQPYAVQQAEASECVTEIGGNQAFWVFSDSLFSQPRRGQPDRQKLLDKAILSTGLEPEAIRQCISSHTYKNRVKRDEQEALELGLRGTPANIIVHNASSRTHLRQGAASLNTFRKDIEQLLKAVQNNRSQ